jgi:hypothetical protein
MISIKNSLFARSKTIYVDKSQEAGKDAGRFGNSKSTRKQEASEEFKDLRNDSSNM